jgi:hypothetical protein
MMTHSCPSNGHPRAKQCRLALSGVSFFDLDQNSSLARPLPPRTLAADLELRLGEVRHGRTCSGHPRLFVTSCSEPWSPGGSSLSRGVIRNPSLVSDSSIVPIFLPAPLASIALIVTRCSGGISGARRADQKSGDHLHDVGFTESPQKFGCQFWCASN